MRLEALELTDEELQLAHNQVEKLAYRKWQEAGCPRRHTLDFWRLAEREWISLHYVPNRELAMCD